MFESKQNFAIEYIDQKYLSILKTQSKDINNWALLDAGDGRSAIHNSFEVEKHFLRHDVPELHSRFAIIFI